ncbi:hypothetical protein EC957_005391 [Mortierella hygrophila]|uniref:DDE-1 domain-containing protein n=1 Tax=Mortierella hygrophila TaxID=979708 RepID=A0A9P6F0E6_9FUNG|nr:hypothetical protein EC957_005391 [Mortierella hygrophila]
MDMAEPDSVLHILADNILADDICDFNDFPHGRIISVTTAWRSRMTQEYGVAYCSLRGEAGSVDKDAIAERTSEIRNIRADFEPDDIYNCNETGTYLKELFTPVVKALRPQVLGDRLARGIQPLPESLTNKGVLLIYRCGAHGKSRGKDPFIGESWKQLRIERLPPNSTSVTQPLDAGIIIAFKQHYLETLSNKSVTKEYAIREKINNEQESMHVKERSPLYPPVTDTDASQARRRYVRLIASIMGGDKIEFSLDKNQKDAQDMAEKIKQKVRKKVANKYGSRDWSPSIERDAVES